MPSGEDRTETTVSADDAFAALGNETRIEILQTLGEADGPLPFSELRERTGVRDSGQFNYHLDKVVGHFVRKTDSGYTLRETGNRVIQAVLSGSMTETAKQELAAVESPCIYCGAPTAVSFRDGYVRHYCTECAGTYGRTSVRTISPEDDTETGGTEQKLGSLGAMELPPAGIERRAPDELLETTFTWGVLELMTLGRGICPRCSASLDQSIDSCENHSVTGRVCEECGFRYGVVATLGCTNCTHEAAVPFVLLCLSNPDVLDFLTDCGVDPLEEWPHVDWTEDIDQTDPFSGQFTCSVDDETLTLTVDETMTVVETTSSLDD